jgi:predicted O-methyltransferase YrrM
MKRTDRLSVPVTIEWTGKTNRKHFLKHLIETNSYTTMAEVGVRDGRTTFHLLNNCPDLTIYAIDIAIAGFYNSEVKEKYGNRLIPIQGNSHEVAKQIPAVDLVFIDADHSYAGCHGDILAYRDKATTLCGHDIDYPGVNKAVNELINEYEVGPNFVWIAK